MDAPPPSLLRRYRDDRRKLLEFLLSSSGLNSSALSTSDFDSLSADYVLQRLQSGGEIDVSEAMERYYVETAYPIVILSQSKDSFFVLSDPELASSPPRRMPPKPDRSSSNDHASTSSRPMEPLITKSREDKVFKHEEPAIAPPKLVNIEDLTLGLPGLRTGLSDDDFQESAYEILLASMAFSGMQLHGYQEQKKEKVSKLFSAIKGKRNKIHLQTQPVERHLELIDVVRTQMQISEAMDVCIRQSLIQLAASRTSEQIDVPQISLGLLNGIYRSDFMGEKYYMQWKSRQVNILEEFMISSSDLVPDECTVLATFFARIRDTEEWDSKMTLTDRVRALLDVKQMAWRLSSLPRRFGLEHETCYWSVGYHLNIRLYEKLLCGIFDILDEQELLGEADEILMLMRMTWPILGITQKIHDAMYGWVLFRQFAGTNEPLLLEYAVDALHRVVTAEENDWNEKQYMDGLVCQWKIDGIETELTLVQAIFHSISIWCDCRLQDYHLHFSKEPSIFPRVMKLVSIVGVPSFRQSGQVMLTKLSEVDENVSKRFKTYVERSIEAACSRVANTINLESEVERVHPLARLAYGLGPLAKTEFGLFYSVLRPWCPESGVISVTKLHRFYGGRLQQYLEDVSSLSKDARSVLSAAYMLDCDLTQLYTRACEENNLQKQFISVLAHYQIEEVAGPIILDWVIAQHDCILQWTERAVDLEEWEALSVQQKQAASIVEVFRMIEETVDQFFGWNLSMNITHLQALLSVIFHSLNTYLMKISEDLAQIGSFTRYSFYNMLCDIEAVEKKHMLPSAPPLTRYTETVMPVITRKMLEFTLTDSNVNEKLASSTISKLCIRLNTLHYIKNQISILEDGLKKSWARVGSSKCLELGEPPEHSVDSLTYNEAIDELFSSTFNIIKDSSSSAFEKICDLIGSRAVFWDLRDAFLLCLYRGDVEAARLDKFLPHFDAVLDHICGLLDDSIRDLVAFSVYRASLEGYIWVLLDGGPSRAFSESDVAMMEDDFHALKEFFIADGEGLPRTLVEKDGKLAEQILQLYALQTNSLVQMLLNASEQISSITDLHKHSNIWEDSHILIRVLCHKKDREASKFLKRHFELPMSSEYDDTPKDSTSGSTLLSDTLKRSTSMRWTDRGHRSLNSFKKKIQEATSEIRLSAW